MKYYKLIVFLILISSISFSDINQTEYIPPNGFVPDENTAIKIAEAIWLPIYGNYIYESRPFSAKLSKDGKIWIVEGTLDEEKGGVPYAEIRKSDCKIMKVYHGE